MKERVMTVEAWEENQRKMAKPLNDQFKMGAIAPAKKRAKYGNEPVIVDGIRIASKREAKRYRELGLLLKAGEMDFLARQVRFRLTGGIEYVADFVYGSFYGRNKLAGKLFVEDAKGVATEGYKIKRRMMWAEHGIKIIEV